ncbi:MAG: 50S ribosomal protein L21 [Clostridia bacterium]
MNDYAVIATGGKQYRVSPGDVIRVELLPGNEGDTVEFDKVLAAQIGGETLVGRPTIDGARVIGRVLNRGRRKKVTVFKYKPKVRYRKLRGHRQHYTEIEIQEIDAQAAG